MSNIVAKREVLVLFTQTGQREKISTTATTWGELQKEITGSVDNKRFVLRETKLTLESSEALLPTGNFVLFAYPRESKAGATAKKGAKKTAKKAAKKVAKKVAKKAGKKTAKKVSKKKGETISKTVAAVANKAESNAPATNEPTEAELASEARAIGRTIPGVR